MIYSTLTRIAGLVLIFSILTFSGFALIAHNNNADKKVAVNSVQQPSNPYLDIDKAEAEAPIVKLASLSVITDYPAVKNSELIMTPNMTVEGFLEAAKQLAEAQKFEDALRILDQAPRTENDNYRLDYYRAQILSWSGNHADAEAAFLNLRSQYPQDADIAVSFGYLYLYQSKFDEAEHLFTQVLNRFPDYQDAQKGLARATAIQ